MIALAYELPRFLHYHKIINFDKLSYKKLKWVYTIATCFTMFFILLGVIFPCLKADTDYSDGLANDFTDTTIEGTAGQSANISFNIVETFGDALSFDFAPGLNDMFKMFGLKYKDDILIKNFFTEPFKIDSKNIILDAVMIFGVTSYIIATLLCIIGLIRAATVAAFEKAESPRVILFKYIKSILLITLSQQLLAPILLISSGIFNLMSSIGDVGIGKAIITYVITAGGLFSAIPIVGLFIKLILLYIVIKDFIKLAIEVIERYLISCFLYLFAPVGFSFTASNISENVTSNYLMMLISSLFVLILNQFFIKTTLMLMESSFSIQAALRPITLVFFLLAWMRIGRHIDENLKAMGLNTARTGGNLFDSAIGAGMAAMATISSASNATGSLINAGGLATSDPNAVQIASVLKGRPISKEQAENQIMNHSFDAANNLPVRDAQVSNLFDGNSNSVADRQFSLHPDEYMTRAFGSDWQQKIAGAEGFINADSISKNSSGIISGIGSDKDGNEFEFALANNGKGLSHPQPFAETSTNGTPWQIQYGHKGNFHGIKNSEQFDGEEGINNFLKRTGMSQENFSTLTGQDVSNVTSISMQNGSARLNSENGTLGAIHDIDGSFRYSNTSTAPAFGTKGIDRSSQNTAGSAKLQPSIIEGNLENQGISKPSMPEGSNWKHKNEIIDPYTGTQDDSYINISPDNTENAFYDTNTGIVYTKADIADNLDSNPVYTEANMDKAYELVENYNSKHGDDMTVAPIEFISNENDNVEFNEDAFAEYATEYTDYQKHYANEEKNLIEDENEYLSSQLMNKENLLSVNEIDANEKLIHATSKEHGPVTYSYRVVYDQGPEKNERIIGGNDNHNMLAYKEVPNHRVN